jgi:hypothetical protein
MKPFMQFSVKLIGADAFDERLLYLKNRVQRTIPRQAIYAGIRLIAKRQRSAVPQRFKDGKLKGGIGSRAWVTRDDEARAKSGVRIGDASEKSETIARDAARSRTAKRPSRLLRSRVGRKGVGAVLHWFVLGTGPRFNGRTTRAPGRRGKMTVLPRSKTGRAHVKAVSRYRDGRFKRAFSPFRYTGFIARAKFVPDIGSVGRSAMPEAIQKIRETFVRLIKAAWLKQYGTEAPE